MGVLKKKGFTEVLMLISNFLEVEKKIVILNDEHQLIGTLDEFKAFSKGLKVDFPELRKIIYEFEEEINQPITSIDVYNYFRKLTNGFKVEEVKITLREMYVFKDMVLEERLLELARNEYLKNNWTIPTYTKTGKLGTNEFEDVRQMIAKVFPFHGSLFYEAIGLLKHKLKEENENKSTGNHQITTSRQFISDPKKYTAKHYVLAYLFECNASGVRFPRGIKSKLESEGNQRMGAGKGNRFYKAFNEITSFDLNVESNLKIIGGDHWREAIIQLSKDPETVEEYLQSKGL
ncbi:hypothetical protein ALPR1_12520 [Algoriphagus machipongonensis]|uniref:Uncharacterized protein n=2 Tax=Algoriphagus machipongonensis TaxID=388413 RepID=A3HT75_9BACT|nr:hypothetical protein ALPR1_12520 [Algoriphagus machipongonensis]